MRASRAKVCASQRSSFRVLSVISFTCRGFATMTSCPRPANKRLTHGEWVPTSMAIRTRPNEPNVAIIPALVVVWNLTFPQYLTVATQHAVPTASVSQIHANRDGFLSTFRLHRSVLAWLGTATLLHGRLLCTSSALLGAYRIPSEPAFSFHLGEWPRSRPGERYSFR